MGMTVIPVVVYVRNVKLQTSCAAVLSIRVSVTCNGVVLNFFGKVMLIGKALEPLVGE